MILAIQLQKSCEQSNNILLFPFSYRVVYCHTPCALVVLVYPFPISTSYVFLIVRPSFTHTVYLSSVYLCSCAFPNPTTYFHNVVNVFSQLYVCVKNPGFSVYHLSVCCCILSFEVFNSKPGCVIWPPPL